MSKISVLIPVYNGVTYLSNTIQSVLNQTFNDYIVYCVDDSSTDNSLNILLEYEKMDSRIKVFSKPNQGTVPYSWQFIIPYLNSKYTCYLSQDDLISNDYLDKLYKKAEESNADAIVPTVEYFHEGKTNNFVSVGLNGDLDKKLIGIEAFICSLDWQISGFALWKTEIIKRIGIITESFNSDELAQRLWFLNSKLIVFSNARFYYRQDNPNAITKSFGFYQFSSIKTNLQLLETMHLESIDPLIINRFHRKYFDSLFYLSAKAIQCKKVYTKENNAKNKLLISSAFKKLKNIPLDYCSHREKFTYTLLSLNFRIFMVASLFFSFKIRLFTNSNN